MRRTHNQLLSYILYDPPIVYASFMMKCTSGIKVTQASAHLVHAGADEHYLLPAIPDILLKICHDDGALPAGGIRPLLVRHCSPPIALLADLKVLACAHMAVSTCERAQQVLNV
jgi:hypothetical protein